MGTGIVSVALSFAQQEVLSRILLVLAAGAWVLLALVLAFRLFCDRSRFLSEARSPVGLTAVAATAVLGARAAALGGRAEAIVLFVLAFVSWLGLAALLIGQRRLPRTGSVFMPTVSIQSLAVLAAIIATQQHTRWLLGAALVSCLLGAALYPLALARFDVHQLLSGAGDQWVAGGALAISALAISEISLGAAQLGTLRAVSSALHVFAVVTWTAGMLWLPALVASEVASPRLRYGIRRWATVFPVGMYAACSYQVARAGNVNSIKSFATIWTWVGLAVWLITFSATLNAGLRSARRDLRRLRLEDHQHEDREHERRRPVVGGE